MKNSSIVDLPASSAQQTGISRIPEPLRSEVCKAYVPRVVSLGPYNYRQTPNLVKYETFKEILPSYRYPYRARHFEQLVDGMIRDQLILRIRQWYAPTVDPSPGDQDLSWTMASDRDLSRMMARDGLFLLQFLREVNTRQGREEFGFSPPFRQILAVQEDVMKLENQIPAFVLHRILQWEAETYEDMMIQWSTHNDPSLQDLIRRDLILAEKAGEDQDLNSILRRAWHTLSPFPVDMHDIWYSPVLVGKFSHLLGFVYENLVYSDSDSTSLPTRHGMSMKKKSSTLPTAQELKTKGVKFAAKGLLNEIRFDGRTCTFHLPTVEMDDRTDALMRNLIAYEATVPLAEKKLKPLMRYVVMMDSLINKATDVEVLRNSGIIHSHLGTDEEVARIWNEMRRGWEEKGEYKPIDTAINGAIGFYHNSKYRTMWIEFKETYFEKPWYLVAFIGGCISLLLSAWQVILAREQVQLQRESMKMV